MKQISLLMLINLYFIGHSSLTTATQPSTTLQDGTVLRGLLDTFESDFLGISKEIEIYYGIPYAEAPVGVLRFKPPTALRKLANPYYATTIGNSCFQLHLGLPLVLSNKNQSEDCLFLDVFVPRPKQSNAAVLVWIHGGAYVAGAGQWSLISSLPITAYGDIILVTINYRLASLGFMTTLDDLIPGNLGLKDQQFALKWVHENIEAFGGDPSRVTIIGESAGSGSVGSHVLSPGSRGYFRSAIMESGSPINLSWMNNFTPEYHRQEVKTLAKLIGCSPQAIESDDTLLGCLQKAPAKELVEKHAAAQQELNVSAVLLVTPVVDGDFFPKDPLSLLKDGALNVDTFITGTNAEEGTTLPFPPPTVKPYMNATMFAATMSSFGITHPLLQEITKVIYTPDPINLSNDERDYFDEVTQLVGDQIFFCGESKFARLASSFATVYRYTMTYKPSTNSLGASWAGAAHTDELKYVFGVLFEDHLYHEALDEEREMSRKTMTYWTNFVKTGNPNVDMDGDKQAMPDWPQFTTADEIYKDLSPSMTENVHMKQRECHLLENILPPLKDALNELETFKRDQHATEKWSTKDEGEVEHYHGQTDEP